VDWLTFITNTIARVPWEKALFPSPDPKKQVEKFAASVGSTTVTKETPQSQVTVLSTQKPAKSPVLAPGAPEKRASKLDEELYTLYWLQKALQGLEIHLPQHCMTNKKSCDCCDKHSADVSLYAGENIKFTSPEEVEFFTKARDWGDELNAKRPDEGKLSDAEYKKYADDAYTFRKHVQERRRRLLAEAGPRPEVSLEEAKRLAAEEAMTEVQRRWQSVETK